MVSVKSRLPQPDRGAAQAALYLAQIRGLALYRSTGTRRVRPTESAKLSAVAGGTRMDKPAISAKTVGTPSLKRVIGRGMLLCFVVGDIWRRHLRAGRQGSGRNRIPYFCFRTLPKSSPSISGTLQAAVAYTGEVKEKHGRGKLVIAVVGDDGFSSAKRRKK